MIICCDECWQCCYSCAGKCKCDGATERVRHPDQSWSCNNLIRSVTATDSVIHALERVQDLIRDDGYGSPDVFRVMQNFMCDIYQVKYKEMWGHEHEGDVSEQIAKVDPAIAALDELCEWIWDKNLGDPDAAHNAVCEIKNFRNELFNKKHKETWGKID